MSDHMDSAFASKIKELEAENAALLAEKAGLWEQIIVVEKGRDALRAEVERLRKAIGVDHTVECASLRSQLDEAKQTIEEAKAQNRAIARECAEKLEYLLTSETARGRMEEALRAIRGNLKCDIRTNKATFVTGCFAHEYQDQCRAAQALSSQAPNKVYEAWWRLKYAAIKWYNDEIDSQELSDVIGQLLAASAAPTNTREEDGNK